MTDTETPKQQKKQRYHHGDLREALIVATHELLVERGAEHFTLADACRRAGVTTAAPYKHFRDKQEILEEIAKRGFDAMRARSTEAVTKAGEGTLAGLIAMGEAYIAFAVTETAVFRLMFGQHPSIKKAEEVAETGQACFGYVIEQVALYCRRHCEPGERTPEEIALALWTFVHGAASLLIDQDYERVAPQIDIGAMIRSVAPKLLTP